MIVSPSVPSACFAQCSSSFKFRTTRPSCSAVATTRTTSTKTPRSRFMIVSGGDEYEDCKKAPDNDVILKGQPRHGSKIVVEATVKNQAEHGRRKGAVVAGACICAHCNLRKSNREDVDDHKSQDHREDH